ncbi:MAG: hypothetical protein ACRCTD_06865 [Beijerinckiaceae bacterium]
MTSYSFQLFADYHQVVIIDGLDRALPDDVTAEDVARRLRVGPGVIVVHTARNMFVPLTLEIAAQAPDADDLARWDHVTECDLDVRSGFLVVAGLLDLFEKSPRIAAANGSYRARMYHAGLGTLSPDGLDGDDTYLVKLWPGAPAGVHILKQYPAP